MKSVRWIFGGLLLSVLWGVPASADAPAFTHDGLFANAKEVFRPLMADPHEIQLALRWVAPVGYKTWGDAAIGDYMGLYRWTLPWENSYLQWSVGAGIFSRFNLVAENKANTVDDFEAAMPFDLRVGRWSARFLPYHISSHLGDDYVASTGIDPVKFSLDALKFLTAFEPNEHWRIYGGYDYTLRNRYTALGMHAFQGGLEARGPWYFGGHVRPFWATDVQTWEWTNWDATVSSQAGFTLAHDPLDKSAVSIYGEYGAGPRMYGQFYQLKESHWVLGLRFEVP